MIVKKMNEQFQEITRRSTGASSIYEIEMIQSLWSGYGKILRYGLEGCDRESVVVKHVRLPKRTKHPRGWNTDLSHERKIRSYEVETEFYKSYSHRCKSHVRIPECLTLESHGDEVLMVLEDLDASGFSSRLSSLSWTQMESCLAWLANFHATFMNVEPIGLWEVGTYWHLDTRPDELKVMEDENLRKAAPIIDQILNENHYQTFVHGDAKLANFCFSESGEEVSAVDFQYVGGGCGMKDVAYFVGSCLYEDDCEALEDQILDFYFSSLRTAVKNMHPEIDVDDLEKEWRKMYPLAWTDFHRFLKGWSPGHWKINSYSERMTREVLAKL